MLKCTWTYTPDKSEHLNWLQSHFCVNDHIGTLNVLLQQTQTTFDYSSALKNLLDDIKEQFVYVMYKMAITLQ